MGSSEAGRWRHTMKEVSCPQLCPPPSLLSGEQLCHTMYSWPWYQAFLQQHTDEAKDYGLKPLTCNQTMSIWNSFFRVFCYSDERLTDTCRCPIHSNVNKTEVYPFSHDSLDAIICWSTITTVLKPSPLVGGERFRRLVTLTRNLQ